jgi:hypothetical protein
MRGFAPQSLAAHAQRSIEVLQFAGDAASTDLEAFCRTLTR